MSPADFVPIVAQSWVADGLEVYTEPWWRDGRLVCQVACSSALDTPESQRPATQTWAQGYQAAAMIAAAPQMFRLLQQLEAAADLSEEQEWKLLALLEAARAICRRIEQAGRA